MQEDDGRALAFLEEGHPAAEDVGVALAQPPVTVHVTSVRHLACIRHGAAAWANSLRTAAVSGWLAPRTRVRSAITWR